MLDVIEDEAEVVFSLDSSYAWWKMTRIELKLKETRHKWSPDASNGCETIAIIIITHRLPEILWELFLYDTRQTTKPANQSIDCKIYTVCARLLGNFSTPN